MVNSVGRPTKPNTNVFAELAAAASSAMQGSKVEDIITFAKNPIWGLGYGGEDAAFKLFPSQQFILKMLYGLPLDDIEKSIVLKDDTNTNTLDTFTEREFFDFLVEEGRINQKEYKEGKVFNEMVLCAGRRASKSVITSIIASYEVYKLLKHGNPQAYFGFQSGAEICITSIAQSDEQASTLFGMIQTNCMKCPLIAERIVNATQNFMTIQTDEDIKMFGKGGRGSIKLVSAGCSANSLRGKSNIVVIMDEAAFFVSNGGRFSGDTVMQALRPSIASFTSKAARDRGISDAGEGKIILISSPYAKHGIFWDTYRQSLEADNREHIISFKMYTAMVNTMVNSGELRMAKRQDKQKFMCEFGAEFSDTISNWIDDTEQFDNNCVCKDLPVNPPQGKVGVEYYYALDYAYKNDGAAIAIVHKQTDGVIVLDYADVFFSGSSDVWIKTDSIYQECKEFSCMELLGCDVFADKVKGLTKYFPIKSGWFDQFNGQGLVTIFNMIGMNQFRSIQMTNQLKTKMYQTAKMLYVDHMLKIPEHPVLVPELKSLEAERKGGTVDIRAPKMPGYHDDISIAFVMAVFECYGATSGTALKITTGFGAGGSSAPGASIGSYNQFHLRRAMDHGMDSRKMGTFRKGWRYK